MGQRWHTPRMTLRWPRGKAVAGIWLPRLPVPVCPLRGTGTVSRGALGCPWGHSCHQASRASPLGLFWDRAVTPWAGWMLGTCRTPRCCRDTQGPCGIAPWGSSRRCQHSWWLQGAGVWHRTGELVLVNWSCWWGGGGQRRGGCGTRGGPGTAIPAMPGISPAFPRRGRMCRSSASSTAGMRRGPPCGDRDGRCFGGRAGGRCPPRAPEWGSPGCRRFPWFSRVLAGGDSSPEQAGEGGHWPHPQAVSPPCPQHRPVPFGE